MANEYTSIATAPGIATELVQDVWDLAVREVAREIPCTRQFVDVRPSRPMSRGSSVTIEKIEWFGSATVTAMKTPLSEESDVDSTKLPKPTPVTITPAEYGGAVTTTKKLNERTFSPVDPIAARAIAAVMTEVVDALTQDALIADTATVYAGAATTVNTITNSTVLTASQLRKTKARLRRRLAQPWFGSFYAAQVHPYVILDLREETGAGSWRVPNEYGMSQENIWRGEIGEFEGFRFVENTLTRTAVNTAATPKMTFQNYFFGRGALAELVYDEPHVVVGPVTDKLGRFHTVGWLGDLGWTVYENKAVHRILAAASIAEE